MRFTFCVFVQLGWSRVVDCVLDFLWLLNLSSIEVSLCVDKLR